MTLPSEALAIALQTHQAGNLHQAEQIYRQVLQLDPNCANAWHLFGLLTYQTGKSDLALEYLKRAVAIDDSKAVFHSSLALVYREMGRFAEAIISYQQALRIQPEDAEDHCNLGIALSRQERLAEAIVSFRRALQIRPEYVEAYANLGVALGKQGQLDEAVACFQQALQLRPAYVEAYNNLGVTLKARGQLDEAVACFQQALQLQPDYAEVHYSLGLALEEQERLEEAAVSFRQALRLKPGQILWQLKIDGLCPAIMPDDKAIDKWRTGFEAAIDHYGQRSIDLTRWGSDITTANIRPPFQLPYHGKNDLELKVKYAGLFSVTESLVSSQRSHPARQGQQYRLGFLVTGGHEGIFLNLMRGLINNLTAPDLRVTIICPASGIQRLSSLIENKRVEFLAIPQNLTLAVEKIKAESFDLIYYWEVGSDALNYFLPFFRLAPVQCTSWGLSITTGIPQMDYFISSELLEIEGAETHYSERLIKLKTLPTYYYRPALPDPLKTRQDFGLSDDDHVYFCPQNLLKFHPDFDQILAQILDCDPLGKLVLLQARVQHWNEDLLNRFRAVVPDKVDRIQFLPQQHYNDFINLIAISDVMLDTVHYSGGNTTHEALAVGTPIVTLPSEFLRGRLALGRYKKIGFMDCVATSLEEYVDIAVRLGTDPIYRAMIKAKILAANDVLYEDLEAIRELEQFFRRAINRTNSKL